MARLIPSFFDETTPPGEREVFRYLKNGPDNWVALHSLDLAPRNKNRKTEIDFVIIMPNVGILCVEVKSHSQISFDGERWYPDSIERSPFKQASDGSHTFHRNLQAIAPQLQQIPVVHCCVFTRARFDVHRNLSVQGWELIDGRLFRTYRSASEFCTALEARAKRAINADVQIPNLQRQIQSSQVEEIIKFCVPVQQQRPDLREEISQRESEIDDLLRIQQKPVLKLAKSNKSVIISGPAGTGKTLIAIEIARRAAERGLRVGLLCFNQLVGNWMEKEVENVGTKPPGLVVGRTVKILTEMLDIEIPKNPSNEYWTNVWPDSLEERLTDPDLKGTATFDYLVLDEAQDVLARPRLWECLLQLLKGGAEKGAFVLFGDFDHQVLSDREAVQSNLEALESISHPAHYGLSENCRNYRIVGDTSVRLAGFHDLVYSDYLRSGGAVSNYNIHFYENDSQQLILLKKCIEEFEAYGYKPSEITILSFVKDDDSAAKQLLESGTKLRPAWKSGKSTSFGSIQAFKGMENKVIILTDVKLRNHNYQRDLFYTGMTRCTESVRVLCERESQQVLVTWLTGGDVI